jgi:hypothetical protein
VGWRQVFSLSVNATRTPKWTSAFADQIRQRNAPLCGFDAPARGAVFTISVLIGGDSTVEDAAKTVDEELMALQDLL